MERRSPVSKIVDEDAFTEVRGVDLILRHVDVVFFGASAVNEFRRDSLKRAFHQRAREVGAAFVVLPAAVVTQDFARLFAAEVRAPVVQDLKRRFVDFFAVLFVEEVQADADPSHQTGMCPSFHTSLSGFAEAVL